jgi:ribosomal protein S6--L-glutamate ligase
VKLWLFSHLQDSPGNRLLTEEAQRRGHEVRLVRPSELNLTLGKSITERPDLVFTRTGSSAPAAALANLAVLEQTGLRCLNSLAGLRNSRDKTVCYSLLASAGVPIPRTVVVGDWTDTSWLPELKGPPWVVKLSVSTKGQGVCLVESERSLRSVVDALGQQDESTVLVQEFVAEAKGSDIRVVVLGGRARVAARRSAGSKDEFRSNIYLGGRAEMVELNQNMTEIAERATEVVGLDVAGVDLLETSGGYLVVEVNGSPGLTASPRLPSAVMNYLEEVTR